MNHLPSMQELGDVCPLVSIHLVRIEYDPFLLIIDGRLFDAGVQMVMPPFPALLASSTANVVLICQLLGNECPSLRTIFGYQVNDSVILL